MYVRYLFYCVLIKEFTICFIFVFVLCTHRPHTQTTHTDHTHRHTHRPQTTHTDHRHTTTLIIDTVENNEFRINIICLKMKQIKQIN